MSGPALYAGIALAGAVGAPARFLLDRAVQTRVAGRVPAGTVVVNVAGSLLLGVLIGLGLYHGLGETPRVWLAGGFCGSFTTFSTFAVDVERLAAAGRHRAAAAHVLTTTALSLLAAAAGLGLAAIA